MVFSIFFVLMSLVAGLVILAVAGFVVFTVSQKMNRTAGNTGANGSEAAIEGRRRALDIVSQRPGNIPAHKCGKCGATVDSTAELSAAGDVRCNYCNEWSSIL